jgi:hypothetical protein
MRPPQPPCTDTSAIEEVRFAEDTSTGPDAVAGERGAADEGRDIPGLALQFAGKGKGASLATNFHERSTVVEPNSTLRSIRWHPAALLRLKRSELLQQ